MGYVTGFGFIKLKTIWNNSIDWANSLAQKLEIFT